MEMLDIHVPEVAEPVKAGGNDQKSVKPCRAMCNRPKSVKAGGDLLHILVDNLWRSYSVVCKSWRWLNYTVCRGFMHQL